MTRPEPATVDLKVVWVSGAMSRLTVHPRVHRAVDAPGYGPLVERVLALSAEGCQDRQIARRLTAEGFRSARRDWIPLPLGGEIRRAHQRPAARAQLRQQAQVEGHWTVWGLSRRLRVRRSWVYHQIVAGRAPAMRHPATGYYLIPDDPVLLSELQARAAAANRPDSRR